MSNFLFVTPRACKLAAEAADSGTLQRQKSKQQGAVHSRIQRRHSTNTETENKQRNGIVDLTVS